MVLSPACGRTTPFVSSSGPFKLRRDSEPSPPCPLFPAATAAAKSPSATAANEAEKSNSMRAALVRDQPIGEAGTRRVEACVWDDFGRYFCSAEAGGVLRPGAGAAVAAPAPAVAGREGGIWLVKVGTDGYALVCCEPPRTPPPPRFVAEASLAAPSPPASPFAEKGAAWTAGGVPGDTAGNVVVVVPFTDTTRIATAMAATFVCDAAEAGRVSGGGTASPPRSRCSPPAESTRPKGALGGASLLRAVDVVGSGE